jgi:hypothetical protein
MSMAEFEIAGRPGPFQSRSARVALLASLLVHAALIGRVPVDIPDFKRSGVQADFPLVVRLAPPFVDPPPASPSFRAAPRPRPEPPPKAALTPPVALPIPSAPKGDLSAYIDYRRSVRAALEDPAAKAQAAAPVEDENTRANRLAAANLSSTRQMTFGFDPAKSGGMFEMQRMSFDYGEFTFTGWNTLMGRRTKQLIEVRRGSASDIRLAIVRKMIAIIREHEPEEFTWDSQRLGRTLVLSSRLRDNSGLEDFMLQEFFALKR